MEQKKIILLTGTEDAQNTSVARYLLTQRKYRVRCLSEDPYTTQVQTLLKAGAEIVSGSLDDIRSLSLAMQDVYGVFGVTGSDKDPGKEYQQGKNLVIAVTAAKADHFIYSSQPGIEKNSAGQFKVPQADTKAAIQDYARCLKPDSSFILVADYYEQFLHACLPQKTAFGSYAFALPLGDSNYATASSEDIGAVVSTMFDHPVAYKKRTVGIVGSDMPAWAYASILSRVLDKNIRYRHIPEDEYAALGFSGAAELAQQYAYNRLHVPNRQLDLIESYGLNPAMQGFEKWLIRHKQVFEQALAEQERLAV